jgi:hypothetical protein
VGPAGTAAADGIDKSQLTHPEPRRFRDKEHVKFVAKQACLVCGRRPADAHHLRFAQHRALGRKVSDEFTVPLCRGHHREAHRSGDEAAWWKKVDVDPTTTLALLRVPLSTYTPGRRIWKNNPMQSRKSHWSPSGPISNSPPRRRSPEACLPPLPARAMSPPRLIAKRLVFWARLF